MTTLGFGHGDAVLRHLDADCFTQISGAFDRVHSNLSDCSRWNGSHRAFCGNACMLLYGEGAVFAPLLGENIIVGDGINYVIFISTSTLVQYAGFLTIILAIELAIAASLYTYKDQLADGLQKGLNQSIRNYGPDAVMKSADFDAMQENVNF